jgi:virulence factor Mce-like protein
MTGLLRLVRTGRAWVVVLLGVGLVYLGVKNAYGGFEHKYHVSMSLPAAGQQMQIGSHVRLRGVIVGEVSSIELVDRRAELTLAIDERYEIPRDARGVVSLKTLLGAKYIDLRIDDFAGPFLEDGDQLEASRIGPELEDALADGVSVLEAIDPDQLATVVNELATASRGHGEDVARGLTVNANLSGLFARTIPPQLESLRDFRTIFGALDDKGVDLNLLADAVNEGVPVYASPKAQKELHRALVAIVPFADDLADLLIFERADWDRMYDSGDVVLQAIADRPGGLADLIHGLYRYVYNLGGAPYPLPNGAGAAGFTNFIGGNDQAEEFRQICTAFPLDVRPHIPICSGAE